MSDSKVRIGNFSVADISRRELRAMLVRGWSSQRRYCAMALHVGGLNGRRDGEYVESLKCADLVYADGISVVLLAMLAGCQFVERAPTTDLGQEVLREIGAVAGRPPRVALIGGPDGLAERAAARLSNEVDVVYSTHGYWHDWEGALSMLESARPDVLFVGMGATREAKWVNQNMNRFPRCLILTCGGWFGHLAADEVRAPKLLRRSGLEWTWRLAQSPKRLAPRYITGILTMVQLSLQTIQNRFLRGPANDG